MTPAAVTALLREASVDYSIHAVEGADRLDYIGAYVADRLTEPEPGLDVERLARAEWEIFGGARATGSTWEEQDQAYRERMLAHYRAVAAEYERSKP